uniref:cDNA FLJ25865 fis, clone CBR01927 n=1 Tax=Homo sapiens TaxID=9606 RepID=Q8N7A4_HUMAN|nr:unnamed protein product [Homo sapiens]
MAHYFVFVGARTTISTMRTCPRSPKARIFVGGFQRVRPRPSEPADPCHGSGPALMDLERMVATEDKSRKGIHTHARRQRKHLVLPKLGGKTVHIEHQGTLNFHRTKLDNPRTLRYLGPKLVLN